LRKKVYLSVDWQWTAVFSAARHYHRVVTGISIFLAWCHDIATSNEETERDCPWPSQLNMELDDFDAVFGDSSNSFDPEDSEPLFLNSLNKNLINVSTESSLAKKRKLQPDVEDSVEKENKRSNLDTLFANATPLNEVHSKQLDMAKGNADAGPGTADYSQPPATGAYITATTSSGQKLYFPKKVRVAKKVPQSMLIREHMAKSTLLAKPIWKMLEEMELDAVDKLRAFEQEEREHDEKLFNEAMQSTPKKRRKDKSTRRFNSVDTHKLWVDKYRPSSFVDLLGDQVSLSLCIGRRQKSPLTLCTSE
jgi:hypothetical protein